MKIPAASKRHFCPCPDNVVTVKTGQRRLGQCYRRTACTELRVPVDLALVGWVGSRDLVVAKNETSRREPNPSMCPATLLTDIQAPNNLKSRLSIQ